MSTGVPQLAVWPLSGNSANQEGFQKEFQDYCSPHGETKPDQHMILSYNSGVSGVWDRVEIPLGVL